MITADRRQLEAFTRLGRGAVRPGRCPRTRKHPPRPIAARSLTDIQFGRHVSLPSGGRKPGRRRLRATQIKLTVSTKNVTLYRVTLLPSDPFIQRSAPWRTVPGHCGRVRVSTVSPQGGSCFSCKFLMHGHEMHCCPQPLMTACIIGAGPVHPQQEMHQLHILSECSS